jgi:hypothetical protein
VLVAQQLKAAIRHAMRGRKAGVQALRTAVDELGVPVDTARWHAVLFMRPQASAAESSVSSIGGDVSSTPQRAADGDSNGAAAEVATGADARSASTLGAGAEDSLLAAKAELFAAALEQVWRVCAAGEDTVCCDDAQMLWHGVASCCASLSRAKLTSRAAEACPVVHADPSISLC